MQQSTYIMPSIVAIVAITAITEKKSYNTI